MTQDLRTFIHEYGKAHPDEFIRVAEPMSLQYDLQAFVLELERRRRYPVILFENIVGNTIPVVCNVMANRRTLAFALGVEQSTLADEYSRRLREYIDETVVETPSFHHTVLKAEHLDLRALPIPVYFPGDGGPYLTAGLTVAKDVETGGQAAGYHRFQVKGPNKMSVSLHSRRRMFEFQRRAEADGKNLECAIVLGLHPAVGMGSLTYPPAEISKFQVVGGLLREPLQVAPCKTVDLMVPARAEIVIEGEILAGVREKEGPFGEFTGYLSGRSTEHVFTAKAICMRERPWFQSISSGRAHDHLLPLGLLREAEIRSVLRRVIPNVRAVHAPTSGCSSFTAFVSIKQTRPGEARHTIPIVLGVDQNIKFVVIVDDDIDVYDESEVLWALATRVQPDRDVIIVSGSLGSILDPSATEQGLTGKIGIDATRPFGQPFAERLNMLPERMEKARALAEKLGL